MHDLERHPVLERLVLGLVNYPHATGADDAKDLVVAQPLGMVQHRSGVRFRGSGRLVDQAGDGLDQGLEMLDLDQGREQLADVVGPLGAARNVLLQTWPLATPQPRLERLGQLLDGITFGSRIGRHRNSSIPPGSATRISLSFRRARMYRLLAADS